MRPMGDPSERLRNAFVTSMSSRIRAYYEDLPEASRSLPCVDPDLAIQEGWFEGPGMKRAHSFALSAGGGEGLSHAEKLKMAKLLHKVESVASESRDGAVTEACPAAESFARALDREREQVLAVCSRIEVSIEIAVGDVKFFHRGFLEAGLGAVRRAKRLELNGGRLRPSPEGWTRRSRSMDADLFLEENETVRRIQGKDARVMLATVHSDEALVS